jgi:Pyruvate/2-oxoacid:ferredoxin oxidoreductase delta subunit
MTTRLYVYTGSGNSLWVARQVALGLKEISLDFMPYVSSKFRLEADRVGIVFPVHIWGLPRRVLQFVNYLELRPETYLFALAVNAGQPAATLLQVKRLLSARNISLAFGYSIVLPSNYTPWGGPGSIEVQQRLFRGAREKIEKTVQSIRRGERAEVDRGPVWQNILFSWIYKIAFRQVPRMDRKFWTDDKCNGCGICSKLCPAENVKMVNEKPAWLHRCEQCFACLQWCPQEAIQCGKKTTRYPRYHHPEITLKEMLKTSAAGPLGDRQSG